MKREAHRLGQGAAGGGRGRPELRRRNGERRDGLRGVGAGVRGGGGGVELRGRREEARCGGVSGKVLRTERR